MHPCLSSAKINTLAETIIVHRMVPNSEKKANLTVKMYNDGPQ